MTFEERPETSERAGLGGACGDPVLGKGWDQNINFEERASLAWEGMASALAELPGGVN